MPGERAPELGSKAPNQGREKLIHELEEERRLRLESEKRVREVTEESELGRAHMVSLQQQFSRMEETVRTLLQNQGLEPSALDTADLMKAYKEQNSALAVENENQRTQYERCLDEDLREECVKLRTRVFDLEQQNRALSILFQQKIKPASDLLLQSSLTWEKRLTLGRSSPSLIYHPPEEPVPTRRKEGRILQGLRKLQRRKHRSASASRVSKSCKDKDCMNSNEGIYSLGFKGGVKDVSKTPQEQEKVAASEAKKTGPSLANWFGLRKSKLPALNGKKADSPKGKEEKKELKIGSVLGVKPKKEKKKSDSQQDSPATNLGEVNNKLSTIMDHCNNQMGQIATQIQCTTAFIGKDQLVKEILGRTAVKGSSVAAPHGIMSPKKSVEMEEGMCHDSSILIMSPKLKPKADSDDGHIMDASCQDHMIVEQSEQTLKRCSVGTGLSIMDYYQHEVFPCLEEAKRLSRYSLLHQEGALEGKPADRLSVRITGDWRNHLSEEQAQHFDSVYEEKMKDVDFKFNWD
uniref:Sulfotransferase n=1 Tax=Knipowitschia caucasica TaxID=637954 RepID=A0AAV2LC56_KNICA